MTADIIIKKFSDLENVFFHLSRIYAELVDDLLAFSFYRGLKISYVSLVYSYIYCCYDV